MDFVIVPQGRIVSWLYELAFGGNAAVIFFGHEALKFHFRVLLCSGKSTIAKTRFTFSSVFFYDRVVLFKDISHE